MKYYIDEIQGRQHAISYHLSNECFVKHSRHWYAIWRTNSKIVFVWEILKMPMIGSLGPNCRFLLFVRQWYNNVTCLAAWIFFTLKFYLITNHNLCSGPNRISGISLDGIQCFVLSLSLNFVHCIQKLSQIRYPLPFFSSFDLSY